MTQDQNTEIEQPHLSDSEAEQALEDRYDEATVLLTDKDELEAQLKRLEEKLTFIPAVGKSLAEVPVLVSLVRSYVKGEYEDPPLGTIVAIVAALIYVLSPLDIIPDTIPVAGFMDDAAVVAACLKLVHSDIEEYKAWREGEGRPLEVVFTSEEEA